MIEAHFLSDEDEGLKPLLNLLDTYGVEYTQGWKERVPHPKEKFPGPMDYQAYWVVVFEMPENEQFRLNYKTMFDFGGDA